MAPNLHPAPARGHLVQRHWDARPGGEGGRRAKRGFDYLAYVPTEIGDADFVVGTYVAAAAAEAEEACRQASNTLAHDIAYEALARQLLRAESVASSRIEGLSLSHRRLARAAFDDDGRDLTAQGVLGNIAALEHAVDRFSETGTLATRDLLDTHQKLLEGTRDEALGGVVRDEQNWIGGAATSPRDAEFVPPPPELVPPLLDDLCAFCNRIDVPASLQAAIAHAQFETIHPFADGNGRVGRALIIAILRRRGIASVALPPVSLALAGRADRYIAGLTSWRNGDDEDWYAVFLDALARAANGAQTFARKVGVLQASWLVKAGEPRRDSGPRRLIQLLPGHPIIDVKTAAGLLGGTDERARQTIVRLERAGVLQPLSTSGRSRAWECVGLFHLLDGFERDLGPKARTPRPTCKDAPA